MIGEEVAFEEPGQGGGGTLGTGVGLVHGVDLGVVITFRDDVASCLLVEVDDVVRRDYAEGLLDAEAKGAFEPLGHPATQ